MCAYTYGMACQVVSTVTDYQLQRLAKAALLHNAADPTTVYASFMGTFGLATNSLSLLLSLFGTSAIIKGCGLRIVLVAFPTMLAFCATLTCLYPSVWLLFGLMVVEKGVSYAIASPAREMLYAATSGDRSI